MSNPPIRWKCDACGDAFPTEEEMKTHQASHPNEPAKGQHEDR
jgi:hypothetical protein